MSEEKDQGRFVWYELMTTDTEAAMAFYKSVVGWETEAFSDSPMPYTMWKGSEGTLGGVMALPPEAAKMGAPPHWMANVTVVDVDATVARVKELGGGLLTGPFDIPNIGRVAVIADPQGATIAVFKPAGEMKSHDNTRPGEFTWSELMSSDPGAAQKFYAEIFGWQQTGSFPMGAMGEYVMYGAAGKTLGGMRKKPEQLPVSAWLYYIHVADIDAALATATSKGARVIVGPMEVPDGARVAQVIDPQGAVFALHATPAKA
jgi:uncharacterized protein